MKNHSVSAMVMCPNCGNSGEARFEDFGGTAIGQSGQTRRVETLPKGFAASDIDDAGNQTVICEDCDVAADVRMAGGATTLQM